MTETKGEGGGGLEGEGWTGGYNLRERRWQDGRSRNKSCLCAYCLHVVHFSHNLSGMGSSRSCASCSFGGPDGSGESSSATGCTRRRRTANLRKGNACQKAA